MWWIKAVLILIVLLAVGGVVGQLLLGGSTGASIVEVAVLIGWIWWVWRERVRG